MGFGGYEDVGAAESGGVEGEAHTAGGSPDGGEEQDDRQDREEAAKHLDFGVVGQVQEFVAGGDGVMEAAKHGGGDHAGVLLLDAAHHHA